MCEGTGYLLSCPSSAAPDSRIRLAATGDDASIDWGLKEWVRAAIRAEVRRLLARYDNQPDKVEPHDLLAGVTPECRARTVADIPGSQGTRVSAYGLSR